MKKLNNNIMPDDIFNRNPFVEENSFYYLDGPDELTEYACPSLPEKRTRGLETERKNKLFEQLKSFAETKSSEVENINGKQLVKKM